MPNKCCVIGCRSNYKGNKNYVTIFSFPLSNKNLVEEWKKCIQRDFTVTKYSGVCIKHFSEDDIIREDRVLLDNTSAVVVPRKKPRLVKDAIPTIFSSNEKNSEVLLKKERKIKEKIQNVKTEDNLQYSDFEDELIDEVQKRDLLFNPENPSSKNRLLRQKKWMEISDVIGVPEKECQRKWKSLRCRYRTGLRYKEAGNEITLNLLRKLDFLKPDFVNNESSIGSFKENNIEDFKEEGKFSSDYSSSSVSSDHSTLIRNVTDCSEIKTSPANNNEFINKLNSTEINEIIEDEELSGIQNFCASLASDLKGMSSKEQKRIKIEIQKLLANAKYKN